MWSPCPNEHDATASGDKTSHYQHDSASSELGPVLHSLPAATAPPPGPPQQALPSVTTQRPAAHLGWPVATVHSHAGIPLRKAYFPPEAEATAERSTNTRQVLQEHGPYRSSATKNEAGWPGYHPGKPFERRHCRERMCSSIFSGV